MVTLVFEDSLNQYLARQLVAERLQDVRARLPQNVQPRLGPMATAFGEVYQYTLEGGKSLMDAKTYQDWTLRYALRSVPGVSEVNAWGGQSKQYAIEIDPVALRRYGLTVHDVVQRVADNNSNFGGGYIEHAEEQYTVRGLGRYSQPADLETVVVLSRQGVPVLLRDIGNVTQSPILRYGATLSETTRSSPHGNHTERRKRQIAIERIKARLAKMHLPEGYRLRAFYDQSEIINGTIHTVRRNLLEAGLLVTTVLLLFLGDIRAALIVAAMIPLSMLFGFIGMAIFGVSANLMSLGAIDFGMIVDGSVVMIENSVHQLEEANEEPSVAGLREARIPRGRAAHPFRGRHHHRRLLPSSLLQGLEGRMFRPMAITICSALLGSLILALTGVPTLSSYLLKAKAPHRQNLSDRWFGALRRAYARSLDAATARRGILLALSLLMIGAAIVSLKYIGTEFMPKLDEGSILITSRKLPGISLTQSIDVSKEIAATMRSFPEITGVVTKLGRPDVATEAMGIYESDSYLQLAPKEQWKCCRNKQELIEKLRTPFRRYRAWPTRSHSRWKCAWTRR